MRAKNRSFLRDKRLIKQTILRYNASAAIAKTPAASPSHIDAQHKLSSPSFISRSVRPASAPHIPAKTSCIKNMKHPFRVRKQSPSGTTKQFRKIEQQYSPAKSAQRPTQNPCRHHIPGRKQIQRHKEKIQKHVLQNPPGRFIRHIGKKQGTAIMQQHIDRKKQRQTPIPPLLPHIYLKTAPIHHNIDKKSQYHKNIKERIIENINAPQQKKSYYKKP